MSEHIDDETFEKLAMHELEEPARVAALAHVTCGQCAAIYKVLLGVEDGARQARLLAPAPRTRLWLGAVAAAVAIAAGIVLWIAQRPAPANVVRGSGDAELSLIAPTGDVRPPIVLSWEPTTATTYRVDVLTREGRLVWSRTTPTASLAWPLDAATSPGDYQWLVTALDGNVVVRESQAGSFRIVP